MAVMEFVFRDWGHFAGMIILVMVAGGFVIGIIEAARGR